jgi:DNA polymerase-1
MVSAGGEPTQATYGMQTMIAKLIEDRKPVLLGVALEGGPSFRGALDPRYKATRPPLPADLAVQLKRCSEIVTPTASRARPRLRGGRRDRTM